jgi:hypothetical protein
MFFKFIINLFAVSGFLSSAEEWVTVPKIPKAEEVAGEIDPSIWVLFSKKYDSEHILIRFPDDPVYRTTENGFLARSLKGSEIFELLVQNVQAELGGDSAFELEGKWVQERVFQGGDHTYRLRVYSLTPETKNSARFFNSFRISP